MNIREDLYQKLKSHRGAISELSDKLGVHRNTIRFALNGATQNPNTEILEAAAEFLLEKEEAKAKSITNTERLVRKAIQVTVVL